jgi:hypothetical protein
MTTLTDARWLLLSVVLLVTSVTLMAVDGFRLPQLEQSAATSYLDTANARVASALDDAASRDDALEEIALGISATMPAPDALWTSHVNRYATDAAAELWQTERAVPLLTYPAYAVPVDPTWSEDPNTDLAWQTHYQSLSWLQAPARAYELTGDESYREDVRGYLLDWIEDSIGGPAPSPRTWYDGAVGYRVDVIVQLWRPVLADVLTGADLHRVLAALHRHGELLHGYLFEDRFRGHNHALFHALSLYNLAVSFPVLRDAAEWRRDARARISSLLPEMVALDEGVSLEQAANYHFVAMRLFTNAHEYLTRHQDGLTPDELAALGRMASFGARLLTPTGQLPAIGDTSYGVLDADRHITRLLSLGVASPEAEFILSRGTDGAAPPPVSYFPRSGYLLARPEYGMDGTWENDLQLIVDTQGKLKPHGHHDAMNVLLHAAGGPLLVDSGGPYAHGNPFRQALVGAYAHNTVVADGVVDERGSAFDVRFVEEENWTWLAGTVDLSPATRDRRVVLLLEPNVVVVVDLLSSTDDARHVYELLYHLPPDSQVTGADSGTVRASPAGMGYAIEASSSGSVSVVEGEEEPPLGWVTTGHALRTPAPTLVRRQQVRDGWFAAVFVAGAEQAAPRLSVEEQGTGGLALEIADGDRTWQVSLSEDGDVLAIE